MQQIINFIVRYKIPVLYFFLLIVSLAFTAQSHSYHRSRFFNSANWVSGILYNTSHSITHYFSLGTENEKLLEENRRLRQLLFNQEEADSIDLDSASSTYVVRKARVIKNSYASPNNYITINRGRRDSVQQDMGVITSEGVLGIVEHVTGRFAAVQSILNTKSIINAKIKNTDYFGSLTWDTRRYNVVQLEDIPRVVPVLVGDTIVTGAMSSIFPENIPIGVIREFEREESESFYRIDVELFNDMANLSDVYIIENRDRPELLELEERMADEE